MLLVGLLTAEKKLILIVAHQNPPHLVCEDGYLGGLSARLFGGVGGGHVEAPFT
jgi:hypothetical protein